MLSQFLICLLVASVHSQSPEPEPSPPIIPNDPQLQPADGSFDFVYHQPEIKNAARMFIQIYTNPLKWLQDYLGGLKASSQALMLYKLYKSAAATLKGTKCELSDDDKLSMEEDLEDIHDSIDTCVKSLSYKNFDAVKDLVTQNLVIIQNLDNNITLDLQHCLSGFYPRPLCSQLFNQEKDNLRKATSHDIFIGIYDMNIDAFKEAIKEVDQCIDEDTSCTVDDINDALQGIDNCKR